MTILEQILETKAAEVTFAKRQRSLSELEAAISGAAGRGSPRQCVPESPKANQP